MSMPSANNQKIDDVVQMLTRIAYNISEAIRVGVAGALNACAAP
jgi:hypothetical protein